MADTSYTYWKQQTLAGAIDLLTANLKLMLVRTGGANYNPNFATDQFLSIIPAGAQVATSPQLTGVSVTSGILNAGNTVFSAVPSGAAAQALVLFIDTGNQATSTLIAYFDSYSGLPITPNGSDINVAFPTGTDKIFALVG